MATATAGWTDYAHLKASASDKVWKVQTNAEGDFRCSCPSFIFSGRGGAKRTCKHCAWAVDDRRQGGTATTASTVVQRGAAAAQPACWPEATTILDAMLSKAGISTLSAPVRRTMIEVLAARLASFMPPKPKAPESLTPTGVRLITWED